MNLHYIILHLEFYLNENKHYILHSVLNKNTLHMIIYLSTWYPIGGAVWQGLGHVALMEEMCH